MEADPDNGEHVRVALEPGHSEPAKLPPTVNCVLKVENWRVVGELCPRAAARQPHYTIELETNLRED